jgi:hypothetical protein
MLMNGILLITAVAMLFGAAVAAILLGLHLRLRRLEKE